MTDNSSQIFIFHDEFEKINKSFEHQLEIRCLDLHSIQLALTNLPGIAEVNIPSVYISYFLKKTPVEIQNQLASYTNDNVQSMLSRTNNYFAQNILHLAEEHLNHGFILLKSIRALSSAKVSSSIFNGHLEREKDKKRLFGQLSKSIQEVIGNIDKNIIPDNAPYYSYLTNYISLRNCFTHRSGIITELEKDLEIRLPYISEEQIAEAKESNSTEPINPQTIIRKWDVGDKIELTLNEVEGLSLGLLNTVRGIIRDMYKAADKHVETLSKK